jgi:hypothetical protein
MLGHPPRGPAMNRIRFSIAALLVVALFLAIALAALRESTDLWDSGLFGTTLVLLLISVLLAVHRIGRRRAYWLGFALFGWAYLGASLVPPIEARLPTTLGLARVDSWRASRVVLWEEDLFVRGVRSFDASASGQGTMAPDIPSPPKRWVVSVFRTPTTSPSPNYIKRLVGLPSGPSEAFLRIGHTLFALAFAGLGGLLSRYLFVRNQHAANGGVTPTQTISDA